MALSPNLRLGAAGLLALAGPVLVTLLTSTWPAPPRLALGVFVLAVVAWTLTELDDTVVALVAALALLATGVLPAASFYAALGSELVWLLLSGFVLAAVVQRVGLMELLTQRLLAGCRHPRSLFYRLTLAVAATAFVVPSTSGRAALLLPLWQQLVVQVPTPLARALALLVPSVILLSAGASLLGAGAHLLALEALRAQQLWQPGFVAWMLLAAPFAWLSCVLATELVLRLFVPKAQRQLLLDVPPPFVQPWTAAQRGTASVLLFGLLAMSASPWLGLPLPLVAMAAALLACCKALTGVQWKTALKGVEWNLLLFMAATLMLGQALQDTGAAERVAAALVEQPLIAQAPPSLLWLVVVLLALLSHLLITSRTARAAVLIPSVALPMAALGLDVSLLILVLVLGSGFCQTFAVSAKPVALFSERAALPGRDLLLLALALLPGLALLLWAFALWVWPPLLQLLSSR